MDISLLLMNFFPIFTFNCQFQLFCTISGKIVNIFRRFAPFAALFVQFCVRNGKFFSASRHLKHTMKICAGVGMKKQGRNWHVFVWGGEKLEVLGKIFTLESVTFAITQSSEQNRTQAIQLFCMQLLTYFFQMIAW